MTDLADHGPIQSCGHSVYRVAKISGVGLVCLDCGEWEEVPELTAGLANMFRRKDRPMTDLAEFLLERIAEDEAAAKDAGRPEELYPYGDTRLNPFASEKVPDAVRDYLGGSWGEHFARWPMVRVLAECEAKRRIVEDLAGELANQHDPEPTTLNLADSVLHMLALPYAAHPDYREEWRP